MVAEMNEDNSTSIDFSTGEALTTTEAYEILRDKYTRLIVLVGAAACGKTTLITSIFQKYLEGVFAGYSFAGSNTLIGIDYRCHLSRISSLSEIQETERTTQGTDKIFIHFRFRKSSDRIIDLLFTDISGEDFVELIGSTTECKNNELLKRADHIVVLIDGEKIINMGDRHNSKIDVRYFIRNCIESRQIDQNSFVDIILTKWDLIDKDDNASEHILYCRDLFKYIKQKFDDDIGHLRFYKIAARAPNDSFPLCYNVDKPLKNWIKEFQIRNYVRDERSSIANSKSNSEFDLFYSRYFLKK